MMAAFPIIEKPRRISEFEFQCELYFRLRKMGIDVRGEVPAYRHGKKSVFDLVVFWGVDAALIIEVKNSDHKAVLNGKKTAQREKYEGFDLPVIYFTTATPLEQVVGKIQNTLSSL